MYLMNYKTSKILNDADPQCINLKAREVVVICFISTNYLT